MVDEADSKSVASDGVWVRVPPPAPKKSGGHSLPLFFGIMIGTRTGEGVNGAPGAPQSRDLACAAAQVKSLLLPCGCAHDRLPKGKGRRSPAAFCL